MNSPYQGRPFLLVRSLCAACLWVVFLLAASEASGSNAAAAPSAPPITLSRLSGDFIVTSFEVVNGVCQATGFLTAEATDTAGVLLSIFTNVPVRMPLPVNSRSAAKASLLGKLDGFVPPPQPGTNLCKLLGISIQFIDLTVPGVGLNVHVNELSLVVRGDRGTRLGDALCALIGEGAYQNIDAVALRTVAQQMGLASLSTVPVPEPGGLDQILNSGSAARTAVVQLGKALFWDMQVGSDGMACATCHGHAGTDNRIRNQLNPGLLNANTNLRTIFNDTAAAGVTGGVDYTLTEQDFPFHQLANPINNNFSTRAVTFDTDDVVSSMGVFARNFTGLGQPLLDNGTPYIDPVFNLGNPHATDLSNNVRRVEMRNAPSVINAVYSYASFWDGRAHNLFNGVSAFGPLDTNTTIWVNNGAADAAPVPQTVLITNAALASQAVAPSTRNFEMSFSGRSFPFIGVKLLSSGLRPLGQQLVHPSDSVLGSLSQFPNKGLNTYYSNLVQQAFQAKYWNGSGVTIGGTPFSQMEANFSLFFGLALQLYESTLVSDQTPFDKFMTGDTSALTDEQLRGLLVFVNRGVGRNLAVVDSIISNAGVQIGAGNCVSCHSGPELTGAGISSLRSGNHAALIGIVPTPMLVNGHLALGLESGVVDNGFANIGVRPTSEDPGRGGTSPLGFPLSFVRQALDTNLNFLLPLDILLPGGLPTKVQVDGAFKIPGLRNVELTGPYFHNGGLATLAQVVQFYHRQGDFGDVNLPFLDRNMSLISLVGYDEEPLVRFMLSLTDERVRQEQAPFDHPQVFVPDGGTFGNERPFVEIPAVGASGRPAAGLPPLGTFLNLSPLSL